MNLDIIVTNRTPRIRISYGFPLSGLMAEIYPNLYENKYLLQYAPLQNYFYTHYVGDNFVVFDGTYRQIEMSLECINIINQRNKSTMEIESSERLRFLDLSVQKQKVYLKYIGNRSQRISL